MMRPQLDNCSPSLGLDLFFLLDCSVTPPCSLKDGEAVPRGQSSEGNRAVFLHICLYEKCVICLLKWFITRLSGIQMDVSGGILLSFIMTLKPYMMAFFSGSPSFTVCKERNVTKLWTVTRSQHYITYSPGVYTNLISNVFCHLSYNNSVLKARKIGSTCFQNVYVYPGWFVNKINISKYCPNLTNHIEIIIYLAFRWCKN